MQLPHKEHHLWSCGQRLCPGHRHSGRLRLHRGRCSLLVAVAHEVVPDTTGNG